MEETQNHLLEGGLTLSTVGERYSLTSCVSVWCACIIDKAFGFTLNFLQQGRKVRKGWKEVHTAAGRRVQVEFMNIQHLLFPLSSKC